jgi:hypothetical protein
MTYSILVRILYGIFWTLIRPLSEDHKQLREYK